MLIWADTLSRNWWLDLENIMMKKERGWLAFLKMFIRGSFRRGMKDSVKEITRIRTMMIWRRSITSRGYHNQSKIPYWLIWKRLKRIQIRSSLPVKPKLRYEYFYGIRYDCGRQLQAIARAIYLCPTLIECWKNIGYMHINYDTDEYVIRTAMLILYPCPPGSNLL